MSDPLATSPAALEAGADVLLLQPAFLGDVVLSTALLESWHRHRPKDRLSILVRKEAAGFFSGHPFLEGVLAWDRSGWGKYPRLVGLAAEARRRRPEVVVNFHRFTSMAAVSMCSGAHRTLGFATGATYEGNEFHPRAPHAFGDGRHETERNHGLVASFLGAWDAAEDRPRLYPGPEDVKAASAWPANAIVLCPGSVWATKRWPAKHWARLADVLCGVDPDRAIILLGGRGDEPGFEEIRGECQRAQPLSCAGGLNLLGSAALMARSCTVVSNDSAPLHIAGAMDVPTVGVFCSTTPRFGFGVLPAMRAQGRAENVEVVEGQLDCKPCGRHGHSKCPQRHFRCGEELGVERVVEAVARVSNPPS
jgi:heptosyltransferase-2